MPHPPGDAPHPAVRRLSLYLRELEAMQDRHQCTVSSRKIAQALDLTDAQVRKDLAYFGQFGRPGVGYEVGPLTQGLRRILGTDRVLKTLVVGTGNLGRALAAYPGFRSKGFELVALFDSDPRKVGRRVGSLDILPVEQIPATIGQLGIRLAVLAVPQKAAQPVADQLVEAGIRGILSFASVKLTVPAEVSVLSLDVAAELEQLSFRIKTS